MTRRTLRFHTYDDVRAEIDRLLASGYTRSGKWSLGQMADHLAKVMEMSLDGYPMMMPFFVRWVIRWIAWKKVMGHVQMSRSVQAPKWLMPPDAVEDQAGVARLTAALARLNANTGPMHPSPVFGKMSNDEWREVHLWHSEHHLSYLHPRSANS